jgi:hypothetical protein
VANKRRVRSAAFWLAWFLICLGLWMLLVFKTEPAEIIAGAAAAAVAATGVERVRLRGYAPFAPDPLWSRKLVLLPVEVARDTWLLARVLIRRFVRGEPVKGRFRFVHFEASGGDDPRSQARRATAKWVASVSPNTYLLGFDEKRDVVVLHQLVPADDVPDLDPGR